MNENKKKDYYAKVDFWGLLSLSAAVIMFLSINLFLSFGLGYHPGWSAILIGFLSVAAIVGHTWINISDILVYLMLMGPAATYMSQLTGNVNNMRLPSAMAACSMLDDSEPKIKRDILAAYGVGISVVVNTILMVLLVVAGKHVLELMPESLLTGIKYIVPAMFGAILAQFSMRNIKLAAVSIVAVLIVIQITAIPPILKIITSIALAVLLNLLIGKKKTNKEK